MSDARAENLRTSQAVCLTEITAVAAKLGIGEEHLYRVGDHMAKVRPSSLVEQQASGRAPGKLVLVSAVNPTPAGEGKTTNSVGLSQALAAQGERVAVALREPSLGPVFGIKGGGCGGGKSQVLPMDEINLHFTGDLHAITSAHNLLSALIDNHLHFGNALRLDPRRIVWPRVLDMNDRSLRHVALGLGGPLQGMPREERFDITAASEVMAILALAEDLDDLKARLGRILVGYTVDRQPVYAEELKAAGPMTLLLRQALQPNLVQTVEGVPAFVHAGPFANIAHGCNSVIATKTALGHADIVVTEAGFGFDLGAEKFLNIKCRGAGLYPDALVLVTTVRAMKMHGGVAKADLALADRKALRAGLANLDRHLASAKAFGVPVVVSINHFTGDRRAELKVIEDHCAEQGVPCAVSKVFSEGGAGGARVAEYVLEALKGASPEPTFTYALSDDIEQKIQKIVRTIYGGSDVILTQKARNQLKLIDRLGLAKLPVCMAKTQYSVSDDPKAVGAPTGFQVTVSELRIAAGAGFIVAVTGAMMTMPGLPRRPASEAMDVRADGSAVGLF